MSEAIHYWIDDEGYECRMLADGHLQCRGTSPGRWLAAKDFIAVEELLRLLHMNPDLRHKEPPSKGSSEGK